MPTWNEFDFTRYLAAKKTVDDRALNARVWDRLAAALRERGGSPLRVVEAGAGIGTMVERTLERGLFPGNVSYTAVDALAENIDRGRTRLPVWAAEHGYTMEASNGRLKFQQDKQTIRVDLRAADVFEFAHQPDQQGAYDLLIAHAFLDLVNIPAALPVLFGLLGPGGLFHFTITFDGVTAFEPLIDPALDEAIIRLYHQTMDRRVVNGQSSGDSQSGRHLFRALREAGGVILEAGSSDWIVFAGLEGYPADEAYFLHFIVHTVEQALKTQSELSPVDLSTWANARHAQIARGELVYIAHQLDFVGGVGAG